MHLGLEGAAVSHQRHSALAVDDDAASSSKQAPATASKQVVGSNGMVGTGRTALAAAGVGSAQDRLAGRTQKQGVPSPPAAALRHSPYLNVRSVVYGSTAMPCDYNI